ncbi:DUF5083 family protein [Staphylococcus caprae]|uniref:DUF5083 family protein n=1 Tax=Staphylococcus caprae TaxID=29380 RepID=UPI003B2143ED
MEKIKKINKIFLSFEMIPFVIFAVGIFIPTMIRILGIHATDKQNFGDKVGLYIYIIIVSVYAITIIIEIICYFMFLKNYRFDVTNVELKNRVKVTKVLSVLYMIPGLCAIVFYFRCLHIRSFRDNKYSGQPAYHFWEFFIKKNRKPIELKDFFTKNR